MDRNLFPSQDRWIGTYSLPRTDGSELIPFPGQMDRGLILIPNHSGELNCPNKN